jgi:hypothetical protein
MAKTSKPVTYTMRKDEVADLLILQGAAAGVIFIPNMIILMMFPSDGTVMTLVMPILFAMFLIVALASLHAQLTLTCPQCGRRMLGPGWFFFWILNLPPKKCPDCGAGESDENGR